MTATGEPRWLDDHQQHSWRALMMGMTLLIERLDDDLRREFSMSLTEYEVLVRLSERPGRAMRMAQLADAMAHSRSRVTHTVARMEAVGYVTRGTTPEDGRGVVATMTEKGYDLLVRAAPCHVESVRRNILDLVPAEDFAAVGRVFDRVSDHLVNRHPEVGAPHLTWSPRRPLVLAAGCSAQSRVRRRCVTRCGRAASMPRRSILFSS